MKKINHTVLLLAICTSFFLASCSKNDVKKAEMSDQQKATQALHDGSPWKVKSVDVKPEGIDESPLMSLQLTFGVTGSGSAIMPGAFSSTAELNTFTSASGAKWSWKDGGTAITLTDAFVAALNNIQFTPNATSPTSIKLSFTLTSAGAKTNGLGEYTVILEDGL